MKKSAHSRTQPRSIESRRAVIDSVVDLINKRGFASVTTAAIAANAGVSWGVLQYHFEGKDAILAAVLESSLQGLLDLLEQRAPATNDSRECLVAAVDAAWMYFSQPTYRAAIEILLNCSHRSKKFRDLAEHAGVALDRTVMGMLQRSKQPPDKKRAREITDVMLYALRGLAISNALLPRQRQDFRAARAAVTKALLALLESDDQGTTHHTRGAMSPVRSRRTNKRP